MLFKNMNRILFAVLLSFSLGAQAQSTSPAQAMHLRISGTDCSLCAHLAESSLTKLEGVQSVWISPGKKHLVVGLDGQREVDAEAVTLLVTRSGYVVHALKRSATPASALVSSLAP